MLESLAEIVERDVASDHSDLLDSSVRHQIGEEPDGVGEGSFRRLEPDHMRRDVEQVGVVGEGLHDPSTLFLNAASTGRR